IALVGILMFALILTTAAAPMIKKESQREKEEEMIWRGAQVAKAIERSGLVGVNGKLLTDLKDLVEGREQPGAAGGTKIGRERFLRPSALCDPMMPCTPGKSNWGEVHASDEVINEFRSALRAAQSKLLPGSTEWQQLANALGALDRISPAIPGGKLGSSFDQDDGKNGDSDSSIGLKTRPILGVMSQKNGDMFRSYYGIEKYEKSPFLAGVPVLSGGVILPTSYRNATFPVAAANDPRCPNGGRYIGDGCYGGILQGQLCRGPNGETIPCPGR
ncbi:MAG: hypothetical protein ACRD82_03090, partial [Blastocatellia bacterium]